MNRLLTKSICTVSVLLLLSSGFVFAQMTGGTYEIYADAVSYVGGGDGLASNTQSRLVYDTGSGMAIATSSGGVYELRAGFQAQEIGLLVLSLSNSSIDIGTLSTASVSSASTTITISTDSETGYSLAMSEDGNLRDGSGNDIDDVADTAISVGQEEYGFTLTGTDAATSSLQALSGSITIGSATGTVSQRQIDVQFLASISSSTVDGSYSHSVQFTSTVNP